MRSLAPCLAAGVALLAGASVANAQTVISEPVETVVTQQGVVTVPSGVYDTVRTVRTVRPVTTRRVISRHVVRTGTGARIVTTRTVVRRHFVPSYTKVVQRHAYERPIYDVVTTPAPYRRRIYDVVTTPAPYQRPIYDVVAPPPVIGTDFVNPPLVQQVAVSPVIGPAAAVPTGATVSTYRYVYEPNRILVIDPYTNVAVQSIPR